MDLEHILADDDSENDWVSLVLELFFQFKFKIYE
jgi:hypothetical protein